MCVYSMVADHYRDKWKLPMQPDTNPLPWSPNTLPAMPFPPYPPPAELPSRAEVLELIDLLKAAKKIDEATGQPDCELAAKRAALKAVAVALGLGDEIP